ncbi:MAG: DUF1858 domain-containing protein [Armatimonadetes bacterium]|nr:DUF1858 domain-containing protein [Armatimonadota bacterium]MDW8121717.1 DUF1858 domain-containing protein [Armatimonadota bacterium]
MQEVKGAEKGPFIGPDWDIQEMVRKYPSTRIVLDRYGLQGCGGPEGPKESVAWFARVHQVDLDRLLEELNQAARYSAGETGQVSYLSFQPEDTIYQPFFLTASLLAVAFGAFWGAVSLALMGITGGMQFGVPYGWLLAHGQSLLGGFVVLMAMGFAYQALPRFQQTRLPYPRLAFLTWPLLLIGILLQLSSHFFVPPPIFQTEGVSPSLPALVIGSIGTVLQLAAVSIFLFIIITTLRISSKRGSYDLLILSSLFWLALSSVGNIVLFLYWGTVTDSPTFVHRVGSWNAPFRDIQVLGFAGQLILGISLRFLPYAYGLKVPSPKWSKVLLIASNGALLLMVPAFPLYIPTRNPALLVLYWFGLLTWLILLIGHVRQIGLLGRPQETDRSLKFIRAAFLWGIFGLVMGLFTPLYGFATGQSFSHNYWAAYRHTLTAGFILLMIVGVSSKVTPILSGVDIRSSNPLWTSFLLLNLGNLGRIVGQVLMDLPAMTTMAGVLSAASGFVQWAGLVLWADDLWHTIAQGRRLIPSSVAEGSASEITPTSRVGEILDRYPESLNVFLRYGFTPLANPVLRKTMARVVTLEQACRHHGVDLSSLLKDLHDHIRGKAPTQ